MSKFYQRFIRSKPTLIFIYSELFIDGRIDSDIVGLRGLHKELKVLGLYGCEHSGEFPTLPAKNIFSNCNEEQLVYALKVYLKRPSSLYQAMNDIYHLYRNNTVCVS